MAWLAPGENSPPSSTRDFVSVATEAVYHATAAILGGEDHESRNWPSRILRLGLLLMILVLQATYTANLAIGLSSRTGH
eukprot:6327337-Prymnesium_polylepis.1